MDTGLRASLRPAEVEAIYGLSEGQLQKMRVRGDGPAYIKAGHSIVLYRRVEIETWLDSRTVRSTSEARH